MNVVRPALTLVALTALCAVGGRSGRSARPAAAIGAIPIAFEVNEGQADAEADFVARAGGCTTYLTQGGAVFAGGAAPLRMSPLGGDPCARVEGVRELGGRVNWYVGSDASRWREGIRTYAAVAYRGVYPGVDLVFHGDRRELEYDFVVAPGADASAIALRFEGAESLSVEPSGDLVIGIAGGQMRQRSPVVYEERADGTRRDVAGSYVVRGDDSVAFDVAGRDPANRLVIDPVLVYGTFLGGTDAEYPPKVAVDAAGSLLVASHAVSADFPTVRAFQKAKPAANAVFVVSKLNSAGSALVYSTYLGGTDGEETYALIAVDGSKNAYVAGGTSATDYPTSAGALETTKIAGQPLVVTKLSPSGALVYSTYVNAGNAVAQAVGVDGGGNAYVTGYADTGFPTTPGAFQTASPGGFDAFVLKLDDTGTALAYSTLLGGKFSDIATALAVDGQGAAYVCGRTQSANFPTKNAAQGALVTSEDWFVTKLNPAGSDIEYSTFVGGAGGGTGVANAIAVDTLGRAWVAGNGNPLSVNGVPSLVPSTQRTGTLVRFSASGAFDFITGVVRTSGNTGFSSLEAVALDAAGDVYVGANTGVPDATQLCAVVPGFRGGPYDAYVAKLKSDASAFVYSTYLGGSGFDFLGGLAVSAGGEAYAGLGAKSLDTGPRVRSIQSIKPGPEGNFSWYLAKLSAESGTGPGGCAPPLPPSAVDSFMLPASVSAKLNKKSPAKSKLTATGQIDAGSTATDFAGSATLEIGNMRFAGLAATRKGKSVVYAAPGVSLALQPVAGSSRAAFKLTYTGDFSSRVRQDGELRLHFGNGDVDCVGFVTLTAGAFRIGKNRGAIVEPNLAVGSARATLKGAGQDGFVLVATFASDGTTPASASDVTVEFGANFTATVPAASFGPLSRDQRAAAGNFGGLTKVSVNYAKQTITATASALDLGVFAEGGNPVTVAITIQGERHVVRLRMVRKGATMTY